jgi:hypothetical protein
MGLLGQLRVRLTAETEDFRRGLDGARRNLGSFEKSLSKLSQNTLAQVASVTAVTAALRASFAAADAFEASQRKLAASAKLTGQNLGFLQATAEQARQKFALSAPLAADLTTELHKLAAKAGEVEKLGPAMAAFLDVGASRGLTAADTLQAVKQAILGIDEGTDKLFGKNPSVIYAEWAEKTGAVASKMTDAQKASALLDSALSDGSRVAGEYAGWLDTAAGKAFLMQVRTEEAAASIGRSMATIRGAAYPVLAGLAQEAAKSVGGLRMIGAYLPVLGKQVQVWGESFRNSIVHALSGVADAFASFWGWVQKLPKPLLAMFGLENHTGQGFKSWADGLVEDSDRALRRYERQLRSAERHARVTMRNIRKEVEGGLTVTGDTNPLNVGGGGGGAGGATGSGKDAARKFASGLEDEWERLRHSVALKRIELTGTDSQRLALEEAHALKLLAIEEQHARARFRLGELNQRELADSLKQLEIRREVAQARRREMDAANSAVEGQRAAFERQDLLLSHTIEKSRILNQSALARLGSEGSIGERLELQLNLVQQTYQLQRDALLADTRLTDVQLRNELLKLETAREREALQLRMNAAVEEERRTIERQKAAREKMQDRNRTLRDQGLGMAASVLSGQKMSGEQIGSGFGGMLATAIGGPVAGALVPALGGLIGRLLDKKKEADPVVRGLAAVERAQRETITTIQQQTDSLLNPESRFLNLPSTFSTSRYMPAFGAGGGGGTTVTYGDTNVTVEVNVNNAGQSPDEITRLVEKGITQALESGRRNRSW